MHILFVQNHPRTVRLGSPKSVLCLGDALTRRGHCVDYLFADDLRLPLRAEKLDYATVPVALHRRLRANMAPHNLAEGVSVRVCDRSPSRYDVVDVASGDAWLYARLRPAGGPALVNRVLGLEHLYWREFLAAHHRGETALRLQHRLWFGRVRLSQVAGSLTRSDHVICLCRADRDFIVQHDWKRPSHVTVVPPGAYHGPAPTAEPGLIRRTGGKLLFVGGWHFRKGIDTLVAAFVGLHAEWPGVRLTIAGSNVPSATVMGRFPAATRSAVTVAPSLTPAELSDLYATHDIFVFPSLYEGFGMVFLEAMAHGMSVVCTGTGGVPDIVDNGKDGFIVPKGDADTLHDTIGLLLRDDALRAVIGERARATAGRYTWERAAMETEAVYEPLVEQNRVRIAAMHDA